MKTEKLENIETIEYAATKSPKKLKLIQRRKGLIIGGLVSLVFTAGTIYSTKLSNILSLQNQTIKSFALEYLPLWGHMQNDSMNDFGFLVQYKKTLSYINLHPKASKLYTFIDLNQTRASPSF